MRIPKLQKLLKGITPPSWLSTGLKLATASVGHLPEKGDGPLRIGVKLLAIADSAEQLLSPGKKDPLQILIDKYDLIPTKNNQFVTLFFDKLHQDFEINRFALTEYSQLIEAANDKFGRFFFVEYGGGSSGQPEDTFYHSRTCHFDEVLKKTWQEYDGRIHISIRQSLYGAIKSQFSTFKAIENPLYGPIATKMETMISRHRRWLLDKIPRAYMFYGLPGTGKTSFAMEFAERLGNRTLKVDATSLDNASVQDISFLLEGLKPDFFLVDDIDKAATKALPTMLDNISRFKQDFPHTTMIFTANSVAEFDKGFLRPNRIDSWIEFPLPDTNERRIILQRYVQEIKVNVAPLLLEQLVDETIELSQDYIREIATQFKYEEPETIIANVKLMRKLLAAGPEKKETKAPLKP